MSDDIEPANDPILQFRFQAYVQFRLSNGSAGINGSDSIPEIDAITG
jgi:hypothetical protein